MTDHLSPLSDETIDASPEIPGLEFAHGLADEADAPRHADHNRNSVDKSRIDLRRILQVDGVLSDMLLTLAASLWTGLAASLLFVLLAFISNG